MRRTALGLAQLLMEKRISNSDVREAGGGEFAAVEVKKVITAASEFVAGHRLLEKGFRYDVVDAVEQVNANNPAVAAEQAGVLGAWVAREDWGTILPAYSRCLRMTRELTEEFHVDSSLLVEPEEKPCMRLSGSRTGTGRRALRTLTHVERLVPLIKVL